MEVDPAAPFVESECGTVTEFGDFEHEGESLHRRPVPRLVEKLRPRLLASAFRSDEQAAHQGITFAVALVVPGAGQCDVADDSVTGVFGHPGYDQLRR